MRLSGLLALMTGLCLMHNPSGDTLAGDSNTRYMMGQTRSVVMSVNGMVATSRTPAVQAGLETLQKGGNAIDAAVAAGAVIGLTEPGSCGIGGDLFIIYWDNATRRLYGLNASGRSPYNLTIEKIKSQGFTLIPDKHPLSWSVPGCVDGWDMMLKRFGTMSFAQVLDPAIRMAEDGFPCNGLPGFIDDDTAHQPFRDTYIPGGNHITEGDIFRNPNLARSYRLIAEQGRDAYYKGDIAKRIVAFSERVGGFFSLRDFTEHTSDWIEPVSTNYRGYDVWELPPNGQGIATLQMLNILEGYDIKGMGHNSAEYIHHFVEAKKLAYADRAHFYTDPDFYKVPVPWLISKEYAAERRKLIDPKRASQTDPHGEAPRHGDTIYMSVADKDRNMVSYIQSNFFGFGSGYVPDDLGFALQNRGALFALDPNHPNRLEPHKRPFHTIIPAFVTKDGKPFLSFGVMGGDMQPQGHVQILCNIIDFGMNIQEAGDAPRVRHMGSSTPTGVMMEQGGTVAMEYGIPQSVEEELANTYGHRLEPKFGPDFSFGGYQAIMLNPITNMLHGASDPRKEGCAFGY